jgi:hypothetical protein
LENTQDPAVLRKNIDSAVEVYKGIISRINKGLEQDRQRFRNPLAEPSANPSQNDPLGLRKK